MDIHEHNSTVKLPPLLDEISSSPDAEWGIVRVNRRLLKPMTNEAMIMAIRPALSGTKVAHVFLDGTERLFIVWRGDPKKVYKQLHGFITAALTHGELGIQSSAVIGFINPHTSAEQLKQALQADAKKKPQSGEISKKSARPEEDPFGAEEGFDFEDTDENLLGDAAASLTATPEQLAHHEKQRVEKPYRKQLQILVAEDLVFAQKLMCEILRGARNQAGESPLIDVVASVPEAWSLFLKKAPDICFIDLNLVGGSGHTLVRAIKEVDPSSYAVIVTANNFEEEVAVARQNNVDSFITKPYNKKQVFDCIDKYKAMMKLMNKRPKSV